MATNTANRVSAAARREQQILDQIAMLTKLIEQLMKNSAPPTTPAPSPFDGSNGPGGPPIDPLNPPWAPDLSAHPDVAAPQMPPGLLLSAERFIAENNLKNDGALNSAAAQSLHNIPFNRAYWVAYPVALKNWWNTWNDKGEHPFQKPPSPAGWYRITHQRTLEAMAQLGIKVPGYDVKDLQYNQPKYPDPPPPINWERLVGDAMKPANT